MNVIITGSNGFIGSLIVRKFANFGHNVIALVKDEYEPISSIREYACICYCDFSNLNKVYNDIVSNLTDSDTIVYHLAWAGVNGSQKSDCNVQLNNIKMTIDSAMLAKKLNAKRFLVAGTVAENAVKSYAHLTNLSGGTMYATAKSCAHLFVETLCKNITLPFVWMQFSNVYGPKNRTGNLIAYTIEQLTQNKPATFGPANQPYDFIFVDDLIEAIFRLGITNNLKFNKYFIGSGTPRILKDYLMTIADIIGRRELIQIGVRADDGIKYNYDMFDISSLVADVGEYITKDFEKAIYYTLENM